MNAEDLSLNIAVNLGRISRWAMEGKKNRIEQFILDTNIPDLGHLVSQRF